MNSGFVKNVTGALLLALSCGLAAADRPDAIGSEDELAFFAQTYYLDPRPDLVASALEYVNNSGLAESPDARYSLLTSFSCIFARHDAEKAQWAAQIAQFEPAARSLLMTALEQAPAALIDEITVSPERNDMNWACFFATGDDRYLNDVIIGLQWLGERENRELFLTAASAKWSLATNARYHSQVRKALEALEVGDAPEMQALAHEILAAPPEQIRQDAIAVLKAQRAAGIWK